MGGWGLFFFLLFLVVIFAYVGWAASVYLRARREGFPPPHWKAYIPFTSTPVYRSSNYPAPRRGGIVGWFQDKIAQFKNPRSARGAYEGDMEAGGYRGRRVADPDEPWDAGYDPAGPFADDYARNEPYDRPGLSVTPQGQALRSRDFANDPFDERETGYEPASRPAQGSQDPFADDAERSNLKSQSDQNPAGDQEPRHHARKESERRAAFTEDL